jgi:murein DD-endopeptidase MepM/ murein hydrolase activator NlpD
MIKITQSVGAGGKNLRQDVITIQRALNKVKPSLNDILLFEDGIYGKNTAAAIAVFQKKYVKMINPDGRIDPNGRSIKKLISLQNSNSKLLFPLAFRPIQSYNTGMGAFGSSRSSGKRLHAGCDLYAPKNTPIRAILDGLVIQEYPFYLNTRALEIDHGNMIVRYCEISHVAPSIKKGAQVQRGQIIAYVGELVFPSGNRMSMLHIEFYKGTLKGPLTIRGAMPYQRRADLIDPTKLLDGATIR